METETRRQRERGVDAGGAVCIAFAVLIGMTAIAGVIVVVAELTMGGGDYACRHRYVDLERHGGGRHLWGDLRRDGTTPGCTIFANMHSHTINSDGDMTPAQLVQWHATRRYSAFVLTDHQTTRGCADAMETARVEYPGRMVVLCGYEWTTDRFHINFVLPPAANFTDEATYVCHHTRHVSDSAVAAELARMHALGAIAIYNHPKWTRENLGPGEMNLTTAIAAGVDLIEVVNSIDREKDSRDVAISRGKSVVAGMEAHDPLTPAFAWTVIGIPGSRHFNAETVFAGLADGLTGVYLGGGIGDRL